MTLEETVLSCFEDTEWHLSLWFPRVARQVLGLRVAAGDEEVQSCVRRLLEAGLLEAGTVDGAEFQVRACTDWRADLYLRIHASKPSLTVGAL